LSSGIRIKDPVVKNADIDKVAKAFTEGGFDVASVALTARALVINARAAVDQCEGKVCGPYDFAVKITDSNKIEVRWQFLSPRDYYHIDTFHADVRDRLLYRAYQAWQLYLARLEG